MNNLIETVESFFSMIEARFAIATAIMILIFVAICWLAFLTITSFQKRRDAVSVELPSINDHGEISTSEAHFEEGKELTIELIDPDDDNPEGEPSESNDEVFFAQLAMETKTLVLVNDTEANMPEVGDIDYEQIKEERMRKIESEKKARESATIDHLREVAMADSQEDLSDIVDLNESENSSRDIEEYNRDKDNIN